MRVTEQLMRKNMKNSKKRDYQDEEETLTYMKRTRQQPLNTGKGVFDSPVMGGINTEENIFNRTAVFRTGGNKS